MLQLKTKELLFNLCKDFVNKRLKTVQDIISSNQKALQSETIMNQILSKVDISKSSKIAHLGSVIITNKANYFLSISAG